MMEAKRPNHRPSEYESLTAFREKTAAYIRTGGRLSVEGWVRYMGISRMTLSNYRKRGDEWAEAIAEALMQMKQHRCETISESEADKSTL